MTAEESIRNALSSGSLKELFLGELGWDRPRIAPFSVEVAGSTYNVALSLRSRAFTCSTWSH